MTNPDPSFLADRCRNLETELARVTARMHTLVQGSPLGIFFDDAEDNCVFVNQTFCDMMELSLAEALGNGWARTVHPDDLDRLLAERSLAVGEGHAVFRAEYRYICPSGRQGWVEEQTRPVLDLNGELLGYVGTLAEITARKAEEQAKARYSEELEARVRERTAELEAQTARLAEMNAALKVILNQREQDRGELGKNILANVRSRLFPSLERLEAMCASDQAREALVEIRLGLRELTEPFCHRLSTACQGLTPMETRVAECIREGLSTKDIAQRLGVGTATVDSHRHHIRRKLGLGHRSVNLRAYLQSLASS